MVSKAHRWAASACLGLVTACMGSSAMAAGTTFAIDLRAADRRLIVFPANAPALNVVAQSASVFNGFAMDFDNTGTTLYGITNLTAGPAVFGTISQTTGALTAIAPITSSIAETNWADLMIAPNNTIYALAVGGAPPAAVNRIYTVNPATGVATLLSTLSLTAGTVIDIGIDVNGNFFGNDLSRDILVSINPLTGATTDIGPTGVAANFAQGMDFDWSTNTLYAALYTGGGTGVYASINTTTGRGHKPAVHDAVECRDGNGHQRADSRTLHAGRSLRWEALACWQSADCVNAAAPCKRSSRGCWPGVRARPGPSGARFSPPGRSSACSCRPGSPSVRRR